MPTMRVRGVDLVYEILGDRGSWVTITPGGRRGMAGERELGRMIAEAGYRVLLHDRRNTGASGIALTGESESMEQAEDLLELMRSLRIASAHAQSMLHAPKVLDPARAAVVSWRPPLSRVSQMPFRRIILQSSKPFS